MEYDKLSVGALGGSRTRGRKSGAQAEDHRRGKLNTLIHMKQKSLDKLDLNRISS